MAEVDFKKAIYKYLKVLKTGTEKEIEKAKYNLLWECSNLFELVVNYVTLNENGITFDFGKNIIHKGTKFFRIRSYNADTDFSNPNEWTAPPSHPQNRSNKKGQEALYLGSNETVCLLETHMKKNKKYVLATYEVIEDINLSGFFKVDFENSLHTLAGLVLNSFLIAPARSERNQELFSILDSYYGVLNLDDFKDMNELKTEKSVTLSLKFGVLNQRQQFYNLTNQLCSILSQDNSDGIRYSSCYLPMETVGIECNHYNVVLYQNGISKVRFLNYEIKENNNDYTEIDFIKCLLSTTEKRK